jgi:hypothetical protein
MLRGKGRVRTQDLGDTRQGALTTLPLARCLTKYAKKLQALPSLNDRSDQK